MLYRCIECDKHWAPNWCRNDTSAFVKDTVCDEHRHLRHKVPMWKPPAYGFFDHSPVPGTQPKRLQFQSCKVTAAA